MKKSTNKAGQHTKLVLRREVIVLLTPPQLGNIVAGGASEVDQTSEAAADCTSTSSKNLGCPDLYEY